MPPSHLASRSVRLATALAAGAALLAACSGSGDGPSSPTRTPPTPPTGVQATPLGSSAVRVTWQAVTGATGYVVQRTSLGAAGPRTTVTGATFDDGGLTPTTSYEYAVATIRGTDTSAFATAVSVTTRAIGAASATLRGDITASRTLSIDTTYTLSGFVKVRAGATLTIPAGVRFVGDTTVLGSSLWILRGAKIQARGTASSPIVFTSQRAPGQRAPGDWGGVVVVGNAATSRTVAGAQTYGRTGTANLPESYGGGNVPNDDSGVLSYVRIEFAGSIPVASDDRQMAGLTLYAVGRGTTVEYVQSLESLGSGIAWYGGTVDGRYLVSYEAGDDHFAWADGYSGRNQFLIGYQTHQPTARSDRSGFPSTTPRGLQGYGCDVANDDCVTYLQAPLSEPVFANFTLVGPGTGVYASTFAAGANGVLLRRGSGGTLLNGVAARWAGVGFSVRELQTDSLRIRDSLFVGGLLLTDNPAGDFDAVGGVGFALATSYPLASSLGVPSSALFTGLPSAGAVPALTALDWTPTNASPLRARGYVAWPARVTARTTNFFGGSLTATSYVGAADPASVTKWWQGWTNYARN